MADSPDEKASQKMISPGQWAPHIDDPDPPDIMSPAEIKTAVANTKHLLRSKQTMDRLLAEKRAKEQAEQAED